MTDTTVVPDGHQVKIHGIHIEPGVTCTEGGVILAHLGSAGDDPDRELAAITTAVDEALQGEALTFLANAQALSDLFAPANTPIVQLRSPIVWTFHVGGVASLYADSRRVDALLESMAAPRAQDVLQIVCIVEAPSRPVLEFVERLRQLAIEVRRPGDARGSVLAEVKRPEGMMLSALIAGPFESNPVVRDEPLLAYRSPLVGNLVRELHATRSSDDSALRAALEARTLPLLLIGDPATRGVMQRNYGNVVAIPTFSDLPSLQRATTEMGMAAGSYGVMALDARALFGMAEAQRSAVALCAYQDGVPVYAMLTSSEQSASAR